MDSEDGGGVMAPMSPAERNLAAEVRAVSEGHRAFVTDGGAIQVVSDTHPGKGYRVEFAVNFAGEPISFTCRPQGNRAYRDDHLSTASASPGVLCCKHAAVAARRLEREGLARLDGQGRWVVTDAARTEYRPTNGDPFAGLPR